MSPACETVRSCKTGRTLQGRNAASADFGENPEGTVYLGAARCCAARSGTQPERRDDPCRAHIGLQANIAA